MLELLPQSKPDAILALMAAFREDPRTDKLDLGVGIYKDAAGKTPVVRAIKLAEQQLLESQDTKAYVGPIGSRPFCAAMLTQVFGKDANLDRLRCAQSAGGSGALRILADMMRIARPDATMWVSDPTWPNHVPLLGAAGFKIDSYPYYDSSTGAVNVDAMLETLSKAASGDIVVLHGCCHNPTGADLSQDQWLQVAELCSKNALFPFIDLAYQGFGDGLEEDAAAVRMLAARFPEMAVAASCSKNLGLYRERTGAAMFLAANSTDADKALSVLGSVIRSNYSMPPDHGANITHLVLSDKQLRASWHEELTGMRERMNMLRGSFSAAMRKRSNSDRFDYISRQKGMFSRLNLSTEQIDRLRDERGIYIVGDGRINIAGLPENAMDELAEAIVSVL